MAADALKPKTRARKNLSQDEFDRREQARKLCDFEKRKSTL